MSQISSQGSSGSKGFKITRVVTDAGTAFPLNGIIEVVGGSNMNTITDTNNAIIKLDDSITITSAVIGDIDIRDDAITATGTDENIIIDPDGTGKINFAYTNANSALVVDDSLNLTDVGSMTDGQLVIGSTGATPVASTITAGAGISVTNAPASVTIASTGSGGSGSLLSWQKIVYSGSSDQQVYTMEPNKGYIIDSNQYYLDRGVGFPYYYYPVFLYFPEVSSMTTGDIFYVMNIGYGGCVLALNADDAVSMQPYASDPSTGFDEVGYPGGVGTVNAFSSIAFQYIGLHTSSPIATTGKFSGRQLLNISTFGLWDRIPGANDRTGAPEGLPSSKYRLQT